MLAFSRPKVDRIGKAGWSVVVDKLVFEPTLIGLRNLYVWKPRCNPGRCLMDIFVGDKQLEGKKPVGTKESASSAHTRHGMCASVIASAGLSRVS